MPDIYNYVKQETTDGGTGNLSLTSLMGFDSFSDETATGGTDVFFYHIRNQQASENEFGTGHIEEPTTNDFVLVRDTVLESSNADSLVDFTASDTKTIVSNYGIDSNGISRFNNIQSSIPSFDLMEGNLTEGYLQPDGLTIANNGTDSDHDVDVTGGIVGVHDFSGNWRLVNAPDETPAIQIDTTGEGGRINSSTLDASAWYEIATLYDSTNDIVGYGIYKDVDRPASASDLPGDFDHFRAMGTPGKTWWVRTNGNSDILQFRHNSSGWVSYTSEELGTFPRMVDTQTAVTTYTSINISARIPPISVDLKINRGRLEDDTTGSFLVELSNDGITTGTETGHFVAETSGNGVQAVGTISIDNVENQEIFWAVTNNDSNFKRFIIHNISSYKAVG